MSPELIDADLLRLGMAALTLITLVAGGLWWRSRQRAVSLEASLAVASSKLDAAAFDRKTGLLSRDAFDAALDDAVARADQQQRTLSVLFVDLDGFSSVNEAYGHKAGDVLLRRFAARVHAATPGKVCAMRLGGDQIVLAMECEIEGARELAGAIVAAAGRPYDELHPSHPIVLTASVGVAAYPLHGSRAMIVSHAATAAKTVKQSGGAGLTVFDPKIVVDVQERAQLLGEMRQALARKEFELFYQPKIDAASLQVTAAEALIRWRHPVRGMVSPAVFIPIAERHGLIGEIGDWVIDEACRQAGIWRRAGLRMRVAINLSAYQMRQDDLVDRLRKALARNELQPGRFTVEITESLAMENTQATQRAFDQLRDAGLHVAIDDFGAGQTSLAYLRGLPASELKLDISLVKDLGESADARTIASALINLAHALDRRVVAEGVETAAQRDLLVGMGCDELQGFMFARPMSARAITLWALGGRQGPGTPGFRPSLFKETVASPRP
ncbi:MAG: bifunctional diguanylate cyclase/phosphodiesterase [Rubrivivax sp.]|nr:bifunctional diguanylate cyclase/phosphodiesterase [Rubrivivax sp.]